MTQDLCRAEFEKWHTERYSSRIFLETRWIAWEAAWNARTARPPLIIKDNFLRGFPDICKNAKSDIVIPISNNPADNSQNVEWE